MSAASSQSEKRCPVCDSVISNDGLCAACLLRQAALETGADDTDPLTDSEISTEPPTVESVAAAFPQLEIIERVGQGGMGTVFKARQPKLNRFVALKILSAPASSSTFAERFLREAQLLARLSHPNIVTVHDFGQSGGFYYLMMEFVDGVNLRQAIRSEHFTPEQTLSIVPKICEALQYAHEEGVLHRDIKPENILLDTRGRVKIADFGIACLNTATSNNASCDLRSQIDDEKLTQTGQILGTPNYMAPEQIERPSEVDHRADIYSLGVVFYELLTGELPLGRFAPPSEKSDTSPNVDRIVLKALEKERERRQQSAGEMKTEIETVVTQTSAADPKEKAKQATKRTFTLNTGFHLFLSILFLLIIFVCGGAIFYLWGLDMPITDKGPWLIFWNVINLTALIAIIVNSCVYYTKKLILKRLNGETSKEPVDKPEEPKDLNARQRFLSEIRTWPWWAVLLLILAIVWIAFPAAVLSIYAAILILLGIGRFYFDLFMILTLQAKINFIVLLCFTSAVVIIYWKRIRRKNKNDKEPDAQR